MAVKDGINLSNTHQVKPNFPIEIESIIQYIERDGETSYATRLNSALKILSNNDSEDSIVMNWISELRDNILFLNKKNEAIIFALLESGACSFCSELKRPPVVVVVGRGGCQLRYCPCHLTVARNYKVHCQKLLCC
ncbi:hypothetical protein TNCV_4232191 [Trichonephila clavipes]|nr:hypothetical protein TNCV_4232191 [Trichonephila clavipes]